MRSFGDDRSGKVVCASTAAFVSILIGIIFSFIHFAKHIPSKSDWWNARKTAQTLYKYESSWIVRARNAQPYRCCCCRCRWLTINISCFVFIHVIVKYSTLYGNNACAPRPEFISISMQFRFLYTFCVFSFWMWMCLSASAACSPRRISIRAMGMSNNNKINEKWFEKITKNDTAIPPSPLCRAHAAIISTEIAEWLANLQLK